MQLVIFTVLGLSAMVIAYAMGLGGSVSCLLFLAILFTGATLRVARPLLDLLKP